MGEEVYRTWFGNNVKRLRLLSGMTQEVLSEKLGITSQHLSYLETGNRSPSFEIISLVAEIFGVSPSDLLEDSRKDKTNVKQKEFVKEFQALIRPLSKEDQERVLRIVGQCVKMNRMSSSKET